jgi:MFS family permease
MIPDLFLVSLSLLIWGMGEGMFLFFQPLYLQQLGADPVLIGTILGLVGIAMTISHLPAGYLADRIGRKPLMVTAWYLATIATLVMALSKSLVGFVVGAILYGITAFVAGPMNSYITAARGKLSIGRALTLVSAIYNLGAIAGPLLGGWIGSQFGLQRSFLTAGIVFIVSSVLVTLIRSQPIEKHSTEGRVTRGAVLLNPRFLGFLALIFMTMFALYLPQPLTVNFLKNERSLDLSQIGTLLSLRSVGVVILSLGIGQLGSNLGYFLAQAALLLFCVIIWKGTSYPWYALAYLLLGGFQTARSLAAAQGRLLVNAANMGLAYGMIEMAGAVSVILAPPLAGLLYSQQPEWIYIVSLVCIGMMILVNHFLMPGKERSEELTEESVQVNDTI